MKVTLIPAPVTYEISYTSEESELVFWGEYQGECGLKEWLTYSSKLKESIENSEDGYLLNSFLISLESENELTLVELIDEFMQNAEVDND
jgi:hypothetical protein